MKHGAFGFFMPIAVSVGVIMDSFFFYIPSLSHSKMCFGTDTNLWKVTFALRFFADVPYFLRFVSALLILRQSITVQSIFSICVYCLAVIPFPQFIFNGGKMILKTLSGYTFWDLILFIQCITRLTLIFPLCEQLKTRLSVTKRLWVNPLANLVFYINLAHVIGASWCYFSLKRLLSCWHHVCKIVDDCVDSFFDCGDGTNKSTFNSTLVKKFCTRGDARQSQILDFGIYGDALQSQIFERTRFLQRILRSFSWGLRNLMSSASNLQTSTDEGETFFVIMIAVVTLTLIVCLPNFQRYAELEREISEKMNMLKPKIKRWVESCKPNEITEELIVEHYRKALGNDNKSFKDDEDVNLISVLSIFPDECKRIIKKDLCFDTLKKVPGLQNIDEEWFRRMSSILEPKIFSMGDYIFREGEPLDFIMFITGGIAWIYKTGSVSNSLQKGDFYGEELLQWKSDKTRELGLDRIPLFEIPLSTKNVKCHTQVEFLVLKTKDLASCSDFPVDSATEVDDSSSPTEEGDSVQGEIEKV